MACGPKPASTRRTCPCRPPRPSRPTPACSAPTRSSPTSRPSESPATPTTSPRCPAASARRTCPPSRCPISKAPAKALRASACSWRSTAPTRPTAWPSATRTRSGTGRTSAATIGSHGACPTTATWCSPTAKASITSIWPTRWAISTTTCAAPIWPSGSARTICSWTCPPTRTMPARPSKGCRATSTPASHFPPTPGSTSCTTLRASGTSAAA